MKWFSFLKSKSGKIKIGIPQVVAVVGVGAVLAFTAYDAEKEVVQKELAARSLSSISNAYNYGGLRQTKEGLSSMNMANLSGGLDGIASAEERARFEAARTGNGQFGLDAADNMGRNVASAMSGSAAEMSDTEGLGMGKNAVVMQNNASGSSTANMPQVAPDAVAQQGQNARNARGASNALAPASARTSGGSGVSNSGFGGSSSSRAGGSGSSSYSGSSARGEGYRLSGAMPGGTNPVSMRGADGRSSSGFGAGRNATVGQSGRFKSTGNDLKDISRQSAKIAANSHRSTTGGAEPFLAAATTSGGMSIENGVEEITTGSADFETPEASQLKAIGNWQEKQNDTEKDRSKWMNNLWGFLWGMVGLTIAMVPLIRYLRKLGNVPVWGVAAGGLAIAAAVLVCGLWAALGTYAGVYWHKFSPDGWSPLACVVIGAGVVGIASALIALLGVKAGDQATMSEETIKELTGKAASSAKGMAMTGLNQAGNLGKTALQDTITNSESGNKK